MAQPKKDSELGMIRVPVGPAALAARRSEPAGGGWLAFAGTMVLVGAAINCVYGITALTGDDASSADELLFGDLSLWGVFHLVAAAIQAATALLIFARNPVGALMGILIAVLSGTLALFSILARPGWSITVMAISVLVIFALWAYGLRR